MEKIEQYFQTWLQKIKEKFAYVLCAPECAARFSYEAGYNQGYNDCLIDIQKKEISETIRFESEMPKNSGSKVPEVLTVLQVDDRQYDTEEHWDENEEIIRKGEIVTESETHKCKIGDGFHCWKDLPYAPFLSA